MDPVLLVLLFGVTLVGGIIIGRIFAPIPRIPQMFSVNAYTQSAEPVLTRYYQRLEVAQDLVAAWGYNLTIPDTKMEAYYYSEDQYDPKTATYLPGLYEVLNRDCTASEIRAIIKNSIPVSQRSKSIFK